MVLPLAPHHAVFSHTNLQFWTLVGRKKLAADVKTDEPPTLFRFEAIVSEATAKLTVTGTHPNAAVLFAGRVAIRGRKPKQESRAAEIRARLAEWKQMPEFSRPSLRALARELGTSHQLLNHYLFTLEERDRGRELRAFRSKAKAKNITLTPAVERRYLAWLRKIDEEQAREAARAAKAASKILEAILRRTIAQNNLPAPVPGDFNHHG